MGAGTLEFWTVSRIVKVGIGWLNWESGQWKSRWGVGTIVGVKVRENAENRLW